MKCLHKYQWVKLPRDIPDMGKGLMAHWAVLASRAAFRKGNASYCGHNNPVAPGMWAGGIVGLKSILGVRSRAKALQILGELSSLGFLKYSLDSQTKKLTYEITDWVVKCSGAECMSGTVYASTGYGFLCLPRSITQRLQLQKEFSMKRMHGLICGVIPPMRTMGTPSRFLHLSCNTVDSGASLLWKRWESVGAGRKQRYGGSSKSMGMSFLCTGCPVPMAVSCLTLPIQPGLIFSFRSRRWLCVFCVKYLFAQLTSTRATVRTYV